MEISRGKTQILPRIDAGFTTCTLAGVATGAVDKGLCGHVPAGPECTTPHIRFLFIVPRFRLGLPPHPASRRRTCPLANLRLYMPGTGTFTRLDSCHARHTRSAHPRAPQVRVGCSSRLCLIVPRVGNTARPKSKQLWQFRFLGKIPVRRKEHVVAVSYVTPHTLDIAHLIGPFLRRR